MTLMLHRAKLLEKTYKNIADVSNVTTESILRTQGKLQQMLDEQWVNGVVVDAESLVVDSIRLAIVANKNSNENPWPVIQNGLSNLYWVNEINIADFIRENAEYDCGDSSIYERCFFHSMMLQARADHLADWIAPFMSNVFRHGGWFDADKEFGRFYTFLLDAQLTHKWHLQAAIDQQLAPQVINLFEALPDADALKHVLVNYCDWRLARAHRYPDFETLKKKRFDYVFRTSWWGVFPFELFAVQAIYRRCTGHEISLEADHPLLQSSLMHPPTLYPLPETPESPKLQAFVSQIFADSWQPLKAVPLV